MRVTSLFQRYQRAWMIGVLLVSDLTALILSFVLALFFRITVVSFIAERLDLPFIPPGGIQFEPFVQQWPLLLLYLTVFAIMGIYPSNGIGPVEELRRLVISSSVVFWFTTTLLFFGKLQINFSRGVFGLAWLLSLGLLPFLRMFARSVLTRFDLWGEPVAIIAPDPATTQVLVRHLRRNNKMGFVPKIAFITNPHALQSIDQVAVIPLEEGRSVCQRNRIRTGLVFTEFSDLTSTELAAYQQVASRIIVVSKESVEQLLWVSITDLSGMMGFEIKNNLSSPWSQLIKRVIDVLLSLVGLILLAPLFGLLALLIRLDSKGPAFYTQNRVGKDGREFKFIKFRSMYQDADRVLAETLARSPAMREEWDQYQKLFEDPRITRVGSFLRRFSIDELPQLINVLKGDMSIVGPRPFFPMQQEHYGESYARYIMVRPGLTGMWQVSGRNQTTFATRAKLDDYYVRNWSVWLDLYLIARTFWVVWRGEGAY